MALLYICACSVLHLECDVEITMADGWIDHTIGGKEQCCLCMVLTCVSYENFVFLEVLSRRQYYT